MALEPSILIDAKRYASSIPKNRFFDEIKDFDTRTVYGNDYKKDHVKKQCNSVHTQYHSLCDFNGKILNGILNVSYLFDDDSYLIQPIVKSHNRIEKDRRIHEYIQRTHQ